MVRHFSKGKHPSTTPPGLVGVDRRRVAPFFSARQEGGPREGAVCSFRLSLAGRLGEADSEILREGCAAELLEEPRAWMARLRPRPRPHERETVHAEMTTLAERHKVVRVGGHVLVPVEGGVPRRHAPVAHVVDLERSLASAALASPHVPREDERTDLSPIAVGVETFGSESARVCELGRSHAGRLLKVAEFPAMRPLQVQLQATGRLPRPAEPADPLGPGRACPRRPFAPLAVPIRLLGPSNVIGAGVRMEAREVTGEGGNRGLAQGAIHRRRLGVDFSRPRRWESGSLIPSSPPANARGWERGMEKGESARSLPALIVRTRAMTT